MDLVDALGADAGTTCVVGAGGKKSTLYELVGHLDRTVLSATVRIPIFDHHVTDVLVTDTPVDDLSGNDQWPIGVVAPDERADRYAGYDPAMIDDIAAIPGVEHVLVKADGARTRLLKAPGPNEPRIPPGADTVLAIASVHAVGEPLSEAVVHRPDRVAAVTGREHESPIRPSDVATILTSHEGGLCDVPASATYIPLLNMVDDDADRDTAAEIATQILNRDSTGRIDRVVCTSMIADDPLVAVHRP